MKGTYATLRFSLGLAAALALLSGAPVGGAKAETVEPLKTEDCDKVRRALELKVPFAPGFRRLTFPFPKNDNKIDGRVCRLLTLGTGIHMEGPGIASLREMRKLIEGALKAGGWRRTTETQMFAENSVAGRDVFALAKEDGICAATIVVGMVTGVVPDAAAIKDGTVHLGRLKPHEREWWISVDCFTVPGLKPMAGPGAAPGKEPEVDLPAPEPLAPAKDAFSMPAEPEPMPGPMADPTADPMKEGGTLPADPELMKDLQDGAQPADPDLMKDLKDGDPAAKEVELPAEPLAPEPMKEPAPKAGN